MKLTDNWFTSLSQNEEGNLIFVTGRLDLEEFRLSRKLKICVEIKWPYQSDAEGMPLDDEANLRAEIEPLLRKGMEKDKLAILTGNYTGGGTKYWVWYTRHLPTFGERLNSILAPYRTLPLEIECSEDEDWDEYLDMMSMQTSDED